MKKPDWIKKSGVPDGGLCHFERSEKSAAGVPNKVRDLYSFLHQVL